MTFREGIVRRGATGYEELRRRLVRNALLPARYPEVIVRAQTIDEAVAAVRLARELGLQLATRSGGHSWCAAALRDGSLLLDLSRLNDLRVDLDGRRMTVGPGLTNGGLTSALAGHGLGFPAGHCRDVGLGGQKARLRHRSLCAGRRAKSPSVQRHLGKGRRDADAIPDENSPGVHARPNPPKTTADCSR